MMEEQQKQSRRGRPVTPYKVPQMVRISQEAADIINEQPNKSEFLDTLIKQSAKKK